MKKHAFLLLLSFWSTLSLKAQDTLPTKLLLDAPLLDFPQNIDLPYHYPSMNQALAFSKDFYELGFWGIDELGDKIFTKRDSPTTRTKKYANIAFKYALGFGFSKYGSELPIPLGVWGHEEFHRSTLGVSGLASKNGNWLLSRWDGTVYGISDASLDQMKKDNPNQLLYSYVAGVQYEILLNKTVSLEEFYQKRSLNKTPLLLYNALYVHNYFKFSTSSISDSVKVLAPPHENANPTERDYAGADLTAWTYDMFNPGVPFTNRDTFPNGNGVNRRIGFGDLSPEAQEFLKKQRKLSLLNFINPSIFFVNKIKINPKFSFNIFTQYAPTHFGNEVAVYIPFSLNQRQLLVSAHRFQNQSNSGFGLGLGVFNHAFGNRILADATITMWNQPESFTDTENQLGGSFNLLGRYSLNDKFSTFVRITGKTNGYEMGNPYLKENLSVQLGLRFQLPKS